MTFMQTADRWLRLTPSIEPSVCIIEIQWYINCVYGIFINISFTASPDASRMIIFQSMWASSLIDPAPWYIQISTGWSYIYIARTWFYDHRVLHPLTSFLEYDSSLKWSKLVAVHQLHASIELLPRFVDLETSYLAMFDGGFVVASFTVVIYDWGV